MSGALETLQRWRRSAQQEKACPLRVRMHAAILARPQGTALSQEPLEYAVTLWGLVAVPHTCLSQLVDDWLVRRRAPSSGGASCGIDGVQGRLVSLMPQMHDKEGVIVFVGRCIVRGTHRTITSGRPDTETIKVTS